MMAFKKGPQMRSLFMLMLVLAFGCSRTDLSSERPNPVQQDQGLVVLTDLAYVDMFSPDYSTQHPLVCGTHADFLGGTEMAFRLPHSGELVHAVFPEDIRPPDSLDGTFVLHGRYQAIQRGEEDRLTKRAPEGYRYFVVSSWKHATADGVLQGPDQVESP
jgi:hypothetical protein